MVLTITSGKLTSNRKRKRLGETAMVNRYHVRNSLQYVTDS